MSSQLVSVILMVMALSLIVLIGIRAVNGERSAYYRISALCLTVGLNFNTTEHVTGNAMSEFGAFILLVGALAGIALVVVDTVVTINNRRVVRAL